MTPIDFWFDFSSPYGYLMAERIDALAAGYGRTVRWHPILLGVIFQASGSTPPVDGKSAKSRYMWKDFDRSARFLGIPYQSPSRFPLATQNAARAFYWLAGQTSGDEAKHLARALYRGFFVEDRDISAPETVLDIAAATGVDRDALAAGLQDPAIKAQLKTACEQAIAAGVFGSPYVIIDGEPFFGADRLPQIERWLASGGF